MTCPLVLQAHGLASHSAHRHATARCMQQPEGSAGPENTREAQHSTSTTSIAHRHDDGMQVLWGPPSSAPGSHNAPRGRPHDIHDGVTHLSVQHLRARPLHAQMQHWLAPASSHSLRRGLGAPTGPLPSSLINQQRGRCGCAVSAASVRGGATKASGAHLGHEPVRDHGAPLVSTHDGVPADNRHRRRGRAVGR